MLDKLITHIKKEFDVDAIKLYENKILIEEKQYDITIEINETTKDHYLYGKYAYNFDFSYFANKKYQSKLNYHGGGYSDGYDEDKNFANIDKFLNQWFSKVKNKQLTIFDYLESEE